MGVWGPGNFEEDTAADHLSTLTAHLIREIQDAIVDPALIEPDEYWGVAVPCNIQLLTLIAKQKFVGCVIPEVETVKAWKAIYMEVWERRIDTLKPKPKHKTDRRKVLEKTFNDLLKMAKKYHA